MTNDEIRKEVTKWLDKNWSVDLSLVEWRNKLVDEGWAARSGLMNILGGDILRNRQLSSRQYFTRRVLSVLPVQEPGVLQQKPFLLTGQMIRNDDTFDQY